MFIIFSGVSASGKNTIMKELCKRNSNIKILKNSSGTTRPPRESDKDNETYIFMSNEEFEKGIKENRFFEHENVHGAYYGILNSALNEVIENQQVDYVRDIDVHGQKKIKDYFSGKCPVLTIFLDAPDEELVKRLRNRGESDDRIKVRLQRSKLERDCKGEYDLVIENIDIETTLSEIERFISIKKAENK